MKSAIRRAALLAGMLFAGMPTLAAPDHSQFIQGPFASGPEVTKTCLQCHETHAREFMKTVHWTWSSR